MKKRKTVIKTYSTPEELYSEFTTYCTEKDLNRSAIIRQLLIKYLEEHKNKAL